ncbi:MAG: tyrosine-type recombinase/integrase [Deltaproteobacteria bacterium]|nr:tyrosine-type recombinase/integrase [Deltaproteobacteria bacterium]MBW2533577.1 tyrosine-type recombinase/integrase [Deltaproteobacteria bacterium]
MSDPYKRFAQGFFPNARLVADKFHVLPPPDSARHCASDRGQVKRANLDPTAPLFPNRHGRTLSRSGVAQRLRVATTAAERRCASLRGQRVSPHTIRHTTAMHLLQSGVDLSVIALWLGHESPATTHRYIEADLAMKQRAIETLQEPASRHLRFRATDRLLAFLNRL